MTEETTVLDWGQEGAILERTQDRADAQRLAPIDALMSVAQSLLHYGGMTAERSAVDDASEFCQGLARVAKDLASRLRADQEPSREAAEIGRYAEALPGTFGVAVGDAVAADMGERLSAAGHPDRYADVFSRPAEAQPATAEATRDYLIERIEWTARIYQAAATAWQPAGSSATLRAAS